MDLEKLKEKLRQLKKRWDSLAKKTRILLVAVCLGVLGVALIATLFLNMSTPKYRVIFPGMTDSEAVEVYTTLQEMGVDAKIDAAQRVMVPSGQWDSLVFELNSRGYPKTTLSYDTFTAASGFTSTEFEKRVALVQQAQDRMQQTLLRQDGIIDAIVTFYVPETSNYIWDQNNQQNSTANVSVMMAPGHELSAERVMAIKHLAATSIPRLSAENVVVVDSATGIELLGTEEQAASDYNRKLMELELLIAKNLEDKVKRLLTPRYGADGVTAVATVALDYDKMVTEQKQYQPRDNGDGGGVLSHYEESYTRGGDDAVGGLVGEENNTDVPQYPYDDGTGDTSILDYNKLIDYNNSYILTQIEKGQAIRSASLAVIVNDPEFTDEKQDTLVALVSKSVNISADNIMVTNLNVAGGDTNVPAPALAIPGQFLILIGVAALLLLLLILIIVLAVRRHRKKKAAAEQKELEAAEEQRRIEMERAVAEHKKKLKDEALAAHKPEENAIANEVREFADENPEITASLIRSMMREEK